VSLSQLLTFTVTGTLPSWRPSAGYLADVSGSNTLYSQTPLDRNDCQFFQRGETHDISSWSSAVYTPDVGVWGAYVFGGGGHNTYYGNERYVWTLDDRLWKRYGPWGPGDPATDIYDTGDPPLGGSLHEVNMAYNFTHNADGGTTPPFIWNAAPPYGTGDGELADGQPLPPHEYDNTTFLPPSFGGVGTAGSFCWLSQPYACGQASGAIARKWDIAAGLAGPIRIAATNKWTRAGLTPGVDLGLAVHCVDPSTKSVYAIAGGDGVNVVTSMCRFDFSAGTGLATISNTSFGGGHNSNAKTPTGEFWSGRTGTNRYFLVFGSAINAADSPLSVRLYDLDNLTAPYYTELTLTGTVPVVGWGPGVCHCPDLLPGTGGVFFLISNRFSTIGKIYKITPPQTGDVKTGDWLCEELPFLTAGGQTFGGEVFDAGQGNGPFIGAWKRIRYSVPARLILFMVGPGRAETQGKMYAYTPPGL
jgi:hypothetical protein